MQINMTGATNNIICGGLGIIKCKYVTATGLDFNASAIEPVAHGFVINPRERILGWSVRIESSAGTDRWLPLCADVADPDLVIAWSYKMSNNFIYIERRTGSTLDLNPDWANTSAYVLIWYRSSLV